MKSNPRLTIQQRKAGARLTYSVQVTVFVRATNAKDAQSWVSTCFDDWQKFIPAYRFDSVEDAADMFFTGSPRINRPEDIEEEI